MFVNYDWDEFKEWYLEHESSSEKEDAYYEELEEFWYKTRTISKDWEELNSYEIAQVKRDYEADQERTYYPERFYCTAGTR